MPFTNEEKAKYIAKPNRCPRCESYLINHNETSHMGNLVFEYWSCALDNCRMNWCEGFELTDIWEIDDDSNSI